MAKALTREQFIEKARRLYGDKYDYSEVDYVRSSEKVCIICPVHGTFLKTPNKHLQGQGCPKCSRDRLAFTTEEVINRAVAVHGSIYDYSKVRYYNSKEKIEIICPVHGSFWQTLHEHVIQKHGCPKCGHIEAGLKRSGKNNVAHRDDVKRKKAMTCIEHFGAKTWSESVEGRKRLHEIIVDEGKLDIMKATCQDRYGTDFWVQSDEGKEKLHEIMSSQVIKDKVKTGYENAYGMHYMQTEAGRVRAKSYIDDNRRNKMKDALIKKYGVPYVVFTDEEQKELVRKRIETHRKNGTFNTSRFEDIAYDVLCDIFSKSNVKQQYSSEDYPFSCDFYIVPRDLYLELNISWTHGGHWFDVQDAADVELLQKWQNKAQDSDYYKNAIMTWTKRDVNKRGVARQHDLNYLTFWKSDLSDFQEWIDAGCPDGKDWEREYSWR